MRFVPTTPPATAASAPRTPPILSPLSEYIDISSDEQFRRFKRREPGSYDRYDGYDSYDCYESYDGYESYDSYESYGSYDSYDRYNRYDSSDRYDSFDRYDSSELSDSVGLQAGLVGRT